MAEGRLRPEIQYMIFPDVNIFPLSVNGSDVDSLRCFQFYIFAIVMPALSFLGIMGNVTGLHILRRQDLTKCSNFLVLCLAVADTTYLLGTNNIPIHLYDHDDGFGFRSTPAVALCLYVVYHFQRTLEFISKVVSLILPCFITIERLAAVFFPLSFRRVLTPRRVRLSVSILLMLAILAHAVTTVKFGYVYSEDPVTKGGAGFMVKSSFILDHPDVYNSCLLTILIIYGPCTILFTTTGCLLIGVKIQIQARKRLHLTKVPTAGSGVKTASKVFGVIKLGVLLNFILEIPRPRCHTTAKRSKQATSFCTSIPSSSHVRDPDRQQSPAQVSSQLVSTDESLGHDSSNSTKQATLNERLLTLRSVSCSDEVAVSNESTNTLFTISDVVDQAQRERLRKDTLMNLSEKADNSMDLPCVHRTQTHISDMKYTPLISETTGYQQNSDTMVLPDVPKTIRFHKHDSKNPSRVSESATNQDPDARDVTRAPGTTRSNKSRTKSRNNRTTRVLLSVCMFYSLANAFNFVVILFCTPSSLDMRRGLIVEVVRKLVLVINSASNFLIYVIFHRKFRESYKKVFCSRR